MATPPPNKPIQAAPTNTVRLRESDVAALNKELEAATSGGGDFKRRTVRWDFFKGSVRIEMRQPGGVVTNLRYAARNLSSDGMGILHSSYVHPGTSCTVYMPLPNGTEMGIEGSVMRCKHFKGLIHEVGIKFKIAINVREFLDIDPMEGRFTLESVDASRLNGSVLHVDDSAMDRRLVRHFLKDTGLNVITVENGAEAIARSKEQFDAILLDSDLPDTSGPVLAEQLRNAGLQTPIILVTADTRQTTREAARAARVNAIVTKPVSQEKLFQAIAEFLLLDGSAAEGAGAIFTTLKADDPTYAFVTEFIEEVRGLVTQLNKALQAEDVASLRRLCFQIKGAAPALGFAPLGHAAELAMQSLDATMSAQESIKPLRALLSICLRVKERDNPRAAA